MDGRPPPQRAQQQIRQRCRFSNVTLLSKAAWRFASRRSPKSLAAAPLWLDKILDRSKIEAMKPRVAYPKTAALTLIEVLAVVSVLAVLATVVIWPVYHAADGNAKTINCVNNLKQVSLAFRLWAGDNDDKFPMQVSVRNGGTMELATGTNAWINFLVMSNELATPKVLCCPADKGRIAAINFQTGFNNANVSYFVSLDANTNSPHALLSGDANFAINSVPVKSGLLELYTNTPVAWTSARHYIKCNVIVLADGSIVGGGDPNAADLTNLLSQTGLATNRLAIP